MAELQLPWELILQILELASSSCPPSAAVVASICRSGVSIARNALYRRLYIDFASPNRMVLFENALRNNPELISLVQTIVVDIRINPMYGTTPQGICGIVSAINTTNPVETMHIVWADNWSTKSLAHALAPRALRSLLCRYLALEVNRSWEFPQLTHLTLLHIAGAGRLSCPTLHCPALTHFACTFHYLESSHTTVTLLVLPRLRDILERRSKGLLPLKLARICISKSMLAEHGVQLRRMVELEGTVAYFVELPDDIDHVAMQALATGISDAQLDGTLWEPRQFSYRDLLR